MKLRLNAAFCSILLVIFQNYIAHAVPIDNGVVGEPTIQCGADFISVLVNTQNPFGGKIFVKGESTVAECMATVTTGQVVNPTPTTVIRPDQCPPCPTCASGGSLGQTGGTATPNYYVTGTTAVYGGFETTSTTRGYAGPATAVTAQPPSYQGRRPEGVRPGLVLGRYRRQQATTLSPSNAQSRTAFISIRMGTCNMKRVRQLNPQGVTVEFTVVVSFHPQFITKVDRAYQVRCFYMEAEKTVSSAIDVSMAATEEITNQADMPNCVYSIRRDLPTGPPVRYVKVGDKVYHRWECATTQPGMFGVLIHSCYVNDGQGQRVLVIDEKGCSPDPFVIGQITYETNMTAYVEAHVFKFADKPGLDFQCVISVCVKDGGGCTGITPPNCRSTRVAREVIIERFNQSAISDFWNEVKQNELDVQAQKLTVVEIDDDVPTSELANVEKQLHTPSKARRSGFGSFLRGANLFELPSHSFKQEPIKEEFCLSVAGFGLLVAFCTFLLTSAAMVASTVFLLRKHKILL